jgi:hypothetical protein
VKYAYGKWGGEDLPQYWSASTPADFVEKFGKGQYWSKTMSYHMLWKDGEPVLRIWTNTTKKTSLVEVSHRLAPHLYDTFEVKPVPPGTLKKRGELPLRVSLSSIAELKVVLLAAKVSYGLEER